MEFDIGAGETADARWAAGERAAGEPAAGEPAEGEPAAAEPAGTAGAAREDARAEDEAPAISGSSERGEFSQPIGATGQPSVDAALSGLRQLADLPVSEHPLVFERTHQRLQEVLGELDADLPAGAQEPPDSSSGWEPAGAREHEGS